MASRTGYVATESSGDVLTTTNFDKLPNGLIGYATVTSAQTGISTITDLTSVAVTVTVNTSRILVVHGVVPIQQITSPGTAALTIREGSTTLNSFPLVMSSASDTGSISGFVILTGVGAGSHTYKLSLSTSAGTVNTNPASTAPVQIGVFDMGPNF